jgi:hypothetical protein
LHGKVLVNQLAVADAFAGGDRFAILQHDRFFGTFEMLGRKLDSLPARIAARKFDRFAHDRRGAARACRGSKGSKTKGMVTQARDDSNYKERGFLIQVALGRGYKSWMKNMLLTLICWSVFLSFLSLHTKRRHPVPFR